MPFAGVESLFGRSQPLVLLCDTQKHTCILTSLFLDHIPLEFCLRDRLRGPNKRYTIASWHLEDHDISNDRVAFLSKGRQDCFVLKTKPIRSMRNVGNHWSHPGGFSPQQHRCQNQYLSGIWCCLETGISLRPTCSAAQEKQQWMWVRFLCVAKLQDWRLL